MSRSEGKHVFEDTKGVYNQKGVNRGRAEMQWSKEKCQRDKQ